MRFALLLFVASRLPAERAEQYGRGVFRGAPVTFRVLNGRAIFDSDIDLGPADELDAPAGSRASIYLTSPLGRWPNAAIPYIVDPAVPTPQRILNAPPMWNSLPPIRLPRRAARANSFRFNPNQ